MDSLKKLKAVSWKNVDSQADEIAGEILRARFLKRNSVEISGEIHPVNREILIANGFKLIIEPTKINISWPNIVVEKDELREDNNDESSICSCEDESSDDGECACNDCKCGADGSEGADGLGTNDLKNILTFILSSIDGSKNKK